MRKFPTVKSLEEDMSSIGIDGINLSLSGVDEAARASDEASDSNPKTGKTPDDDDEGGCDEECLKEAADTVFDHVFPQIDEKYIDYDQDEFAEDLKDQISTLISDLVADGSTVGDARVLAAKSVANTYNRLVEQIKSAVDVGAIKDGLAEALQRMPGGFSINETTTSIGSELRGLLSEASAGSGSKMSDTRAEVTEAYERIGFVSGLMKWFFENYGDEEDHEVPGVLKDLVTESDKSLEEARTVSEDDFDLGAHINTMQRYGKIIHRCWEEYQKYSFGGGEGN